MKRYIKASISESTPDWLRRKLSQRYGSSIKEKFLKKYHIALDRAEYTDNPDTYANTIPIYLLRTDYGTEVYCPGANDDVSVRINGRNRKLGSIAKSKLPEMTEDVVYVTLSEANTFKPKDRYRDPRYSYRFGNKGDYAGQYKKLRYDSETRSKHEDGWSETGVRPANESRARDKSGYKIPSPEERLTDFYTKFPDRITNKADELYNKLIDTRQMLVDADFNSPTPDYRSTERGVDYGRAYRRFADAVDDYRNLLSELQHQDKFDREYQISRISRTIRDISDRVSDIQRMLNGEDVW